MKWILPGLHHRWVSSHFTWPSICFSQGKLAVQYWAVLLHQDLGFFSGKFDNPAYQTSSWRASNVGSDFFFQKPEITRYSGKEDLHYTQYYTQFIPNCKSFDFFNIKFDHSSYLKFCIKYHFFVVYWFINKSSSKMT